MATSPYKDNEVKPPVGLKPRKMHDVKRMDDIQAAIARYVSSEKQIPKEWLNELYDLSKSTFRK